MKKLFAILFALIPAIYAAGTAVFLYLMPEDEVLFAVLGGVVLLSILFAVGHCVHGGKADRNFLAITNVWSIGGHFLLFAAELAWWFYSYVQVRIAEQNGGIEGGLGLLLLIVLYMPHWISYLISRITAAVNCRRILRGISSSTVQALHTFLHLLPITDLANTIWVLCKVKACQRFHQPPIEME